VRTRCRAGCRCADDRCLGCLLAAAQLRQRGVPATICPVFALCAGYSRYRSRCSAFGNMSRRHAHLRSEPSAFVPSLAAGKKCPCAVPSNKETFRISRVPLETFPRILDVLASERKSPKYARLRRIKPQGISIVIQTRALWMLTVPRYIRHSARRARQRDRGALRARASQLRPTMRW